MQLSRLYANKSELFETVNFNCRESSDTLNVIYGAVTDSTNEKRDSHNLGKTTLIHLIDFMFLRDISGSNHFFETHKDRFASFVFYIEIALNAGDYVTIRRSVENNTRIALRRHEDRGEDFTGETDGTWDHVDLALNAAREILDGILDLRIIAPYDYRKALTYFLRTQDDYQNVLQLQKFQAGQHIYWKPFVMTLLGFDERPVKSKYELDIQIDEKEGDKKKKEAELQVEEQDILRLAAEIQNLRTQLTATENHLDGFEFSDEERRLMHELVDEIESRISSINDELYNVGIDIRNIEQALSNKISFKISEIETIFEETNLHFPEQIKKSYEDLVAFNLSVTNERNSALRSRRKQLVESQQALRDERESEDKRRQAHHSILRNTDTLEKFKALQRNLAEQRAHLTYLERQYEKLDSINNLEMEINGLKRDRSRVADEIKAQISKGSAPKDRIASFFNDFCERVLDHEGLFYLSQNTSGNVEFRMELKERVTEKSSRQSEGKSYKQMLCALFDLALLKTYETTPFYHFVYHDGILEGLDYRKKRLFLDVVREVISTGHIQYILSVIDADIPRDAEENRIEFNEEEIVLRLHDGGDDGRLFKIAEF